MRMRTHVVVSQTAFLSIKTRVIFKCIGPVVIDIYIGNESNFIYKFI